MSVTHDMMLFLDRTSHCLVCKVPVDVYTRHKNLDDVVQVAGGRTVRSCLQQVLDVSLACSSAIWLCNKCYADLEQIQLYYNLVKHFRERFHNAVQLGSTTGVGAGSQHSAYGAHQYDDRGLHGQSQHYNNHSLMVHTGQQHADLLLSLGGAPPNQGPGSLDPSIQPYHKYEPPPPPPPPPPLPHQPHHQPQQMHHQQQPHQVQQQHDQQQQQQPQPQRSPTSVHAVKKACEGDFLDNILDLPVIQDVQIKKEVEKFVADVGSDEDDAPHEEDAVSTEEMTETSSGLCLGESNSPSEGNPQAETSKDKTCTMGKEPGQSDFKCTICNQSFKTETRLKRHMLSHRRGGPLKCSICSKGFTSDKQLRLHKLCHAIHVQSLGETTETEITTQSLVDGELSDSGEGIDPIDVGPKVYTCRICQKSFSQPKLLRMHKRTHTLARYAERNGHPLQCPDCDERFDDAEDFKDHVKRQLCDWPWKCHICDAGFFQEAPLKRHLKTHVNESRITCPICHKRISDAGYMKEHIRVHTGELPHECTFCKKRFNNPSNLKQHERIHTGEKPYKCGVCGAGFRQIGQKKVHELTHSGKAPHVCPTCGKEFFWACSYKKHIQIHTNEKPELCSTCGKSFRNVPALHAHARSHSDARPHVCSYCGKGFKTSKHLSVHKRIHTGEKPFICELCGRGFSQTTGLKFHLKSHNVTSL